MKRKLITEKIQKAFSRSTFDKYISVVLFIMLYKVVLTFESVDKPFK